VSVYQTEEEQIEAIKKWWKENGKSIIAGVVIGLGGVLGWQAWSQYTDSVGGQAALHFQQLTGAMETGAPVIAQAQGEQLMSEYEGTPYAVFAALELARLHVDEGDTAEARSRLRWAMEHADDEGLAQIARLRLARLVLDAGELDEAARLLDQPHDPSFAGAVAELRGDLAKARGSYEAAAEAYAEALERGVGDTTVVQMKLDDLPVTR
jgi:predicted negative regulator of RcsB-dependent stress response